MVNGDRDVERSECEEGVLSLPPSSDTADRAKRWQRNLSRGPTVRLEYFQGRADVFQIGDKNFSAGQREVVNNRIALRDDFAPLLARRMVQVHGEDAAVWSFPVRLDKELVAPDFPDKPGSQIVNDGNGRAMPDQVLKVNLRLRSEEHTSELQSQSNLVCRLLLEKK